MFQSNVTSTRLWKTTLADQKADEHNEARIKLRSTLSSMRDNVAHLVSQIHKDLPGITVHDVSHLDALWGVADIIIGKNFNLTPAEAFVFGASILLHDAGMAIAAFDGGLEKIKNTVEWKDCLADKIRSRPGSTTFEDLSDEEKSDVAFSVLRILHASQAEKLATMKFKKDEATEIYLIEDVSLREAFAASIGRIAHSHHWDCSYLQEKLEEIIGSGAHLPSEWTVNEIKIACLLRCADAAHIDARRAPTFLYAISKIEGISRDHWDFQNKLNQISKKDDKIVISSGQLFKTESASSWWLCFETAKMIDREIKGSNAILTDINLPQFSVKGISGVETPSLFARHVRVVGWAPVDAEVRVSDPVGLARTLGGKNLYGNGAFPPLRELIQNGVDAVRARRTHENREEGWGTVRITFARDASGVQWIHVDDQGVGMSRRVLSGPLIDFGKSLWSSSLMREEFPGLSSKNIAPIGKFGIGFFSVFLLGDHVKVISKRFDQGEGDTSVLEFERLSRRPLLRSAQVGELPRDFSTRVSVQVSDEIAESLSWNVPPLRGEYIVRAESSFFGKLLQLVCAVDVQVEIIDNINEKSVTHTSNWRTKPAEDFLEEVLPFQNREEERRLIAAHAPKVRLICGADGSVFGRAALKIGRDVDLRAPCLRTVGGFAVAGMDDGRSISQLVGRTHSLINGNNLFGVLLGDTDDASRATAKIATPPEAIAKWATEQAELIDKSAYTQSQLIDFCQSIISFGGDPGDIPFAYSEGAFKNYADFISYISAQEKIIIPLSISSYQHGFDYLEVSDLKGAFFTTRMRKGVVVFSNYNASLNFGDQYSRRNLKESLGRDLTSSEVSSLLKDSMLNLIYDKAFCNKGVEPIFSIKKESFFSTELINGPEPSWCLCISRNGEYH